MLGLPPPPESGQPSQSAYETGGRNRGVDLRSPPACAGGRRASAAQPEDQAGRSPRQWASSVLPMVGAAPRRRTATSLATSPAPATVATASAGLLPTATITATATRT